MTFEPDWWILLAIVAAAAYLQTIIGFAFGLIVVGAAAVGGLAPVAFMAAVVSVATLVNAAVALSGRTQEIRRRDAGLLIAGMLPMVIVGVVLLDYLSDRLTAALHVALALTIMGAGIVLTLRPDPRRVASGTWATLAMGSLSGLLMGLFSTGGPPVVYHLYRQPYAVAAVRATLLATFAAACIARIAFLGIQGGMTLEIVSLSAACVPIVIGGTVLARRFPPPLTDRAARRLAFALLMGLGASLLLR